jgi:putative ABC transport system permease protein
MSSALLTGAGIECRHAVRGLARAPGFAAGIVLVLGIAIAGMVTVTTAAYELFLRPLPLAHPEQLAHVTTYSRSMGFSVGFSPPMLVELREQPMISHVAGYYGASDAESLRGDTWSAAPVTHNLPQVLSVQPIAGRSFEPADAEPGALPVGLISEAVWRNRFGAAESAIGSEVVLDGRRVRVIGVMPAAFTVPSPGTQLWEPLRYTPAELARGNIGSFEGDAIVVRLERGVTPAQLEDALRAGYASDSSVDGQRIRELMKLELNVRGLREAWTAEQRQPLATIGLASALVFAAALFNVAGLWMTRLLGRSHEDAIQTALGAGAWRRLGRTLVEFLLLGAAGVSLALALAPLMLGWLKQLGALDLDQPLAIETGPVTVAIAGVVLVVSGLPVLLAAFWQQRRQRRALLAALSSGGRGHAGSGARARRVLIVAQVALAMSLLCAMGLLLRSWHSLLTEDLGFEPQNLLVARIESPPDPGEVRDVTDPTVGAALDALRTIPGVTAVTRANVAPFARSASISRISVPGQEAWSTTVFSRNVGKGFFRATGIPILRGRSFDESEGAPTDAVVDERFEELYFPAGGALGETIEMPVGPGESRDFVIVGVTATAKYRSPDEAASQGSIYLFRAEPLASETAVIAAAVPPATLVDEVKSVLARTVGPERTGTIATMESMVRYSVRDREPQLILLGLFALETLALAAIGLFSLLAYSVRARTPEFGVRQAVGARAADIRRHVLGDALRLLVPGLAIGIAGAFLAGYLIVNRLYEVSPADPLTWAGAGIVLALVVLAAGLWPAERAARIQPTEALRHE